MTYSIRMIAIPDGGSVSGNCAASPFISFRSLEKNDTPPLPFQRTRTGVSQRIPRACSTGSSILNVHA
jgi:hypothetical protein